MQQGPKIAKMLRWHVCRVNFARKIFCRATNFLTKNAPKISPKFLRLCSVGQKRSWKKSWKIPSKFPTKFSNFPCEKSKQKITDEPVQERREDKMFEEILGPIPLLRAKSTHTWCWASWRRGGGTTTEKAARGSAACPLWLSSWGP